MKIVHSINSTSYPEEELIVRVAWEYFMNQTSQAVIAQQLGVSRPTISRLIQKARTMGIVRISIDSQFGVCIRLEDEFRRRLQLVTQIVPQGFANREIGSILGEAAASYINQHIRTVSRIAVGWGRTISHIAQSAYLNPQDRTGGEVVEMVGAFSSSGDKLATLRVAGNLAQAYGMTAYALNAPAIAPDAETCNLLKNHEQIREVLEKACTADLAVASLGTVDETSTLYTMGLVTSEDLYRLRMLGAVGEILGRFFNREGRPVNSQLDDRLVGITLEQLRRIPVVMIVAGGSEKVYALLGAIRGGLMNHLVTDENTARLILEQYQNG